jgi:hypothetical protein
MIRWGRLGRGIAPAVLVVGMGLAGMTGEGPAAAQDCSTVAPYVFILLDVSSSMNESTPCSQAELTAGLCAARCDTSDCWLELQGDDPGSKLYAIKQALYEVVSSTTGVHFGFAPFNQDHLQVDAKHWIYEATGAGVTIPGWGAFPNAGAREVFGALWPCDTGNNDNEIGCYNTKPADLVDGWELGRVRRLPKGGATFTSAVTFYIRHNAIVYRVRYTPVAGATPGSAVTMTEAVWRCTNSSCASTLLVGQTNIAFEPRAEFLAWEGPMVNRTNPELSYFPSSVSDVFANNTCTGWEPNTDTSADTSNGYNLRWPTVSDLRGPLFDFGDVIPFDWLDSHNQDVLHRMAPNLIVDPLAAPDFRLSPYLRDAPLSGETFLRLEDESARPLFASGATPQGASLTAFRTWWQGCASGACTPGTGWAAAAATQDPDWACRRTSVILITDNFETCNVDPCPVADELFGSGVTIYAVGLGVADSTGTSLECLAANGGTVAPFTPRTRGDLADTLSAILAEIKAGS